MFYHSDTNNQIQSGKLILDKVFKNKHEKTLANQKKYQYFNVLSKLKSKFQHNPAVTQHLFQNQQKSRTATKMRSVELIHRLQKINSKLYRLDSKPTNALTLNIQSPITRSRRSYSRVVQESNTAIIKRRSNTQRLISPYPIIQNNVKPRLESLMRKHKQTQRAYRAKQMQKYFRTEQAQIWNQINGKLIDLRKNSKSQRVQTAGN